MNRNPFIFFEVAAFIVFLGLGYWVGKNLTHERPARVLISHHKPTPSPIPALPDGERILLLASVDELDRSEPQLRSLWLLTYYLNDRPIQLLPIYPTNTIEQQPTHSQLIETFAVVKENGVAHISSTFLRSLGEDNFWLSGYILLDDYAAYTLLNIIRGLPTDNGLKSGEQIISTMLPSMEEPNNSHDQQVLLIGQYCLTFSQLKTPPQWDPILDIIPEHMVSDIHPVRLLTEIQLLTSNHTQVRCEFPTLTYSP
jgi:hypothetical protein